MKKVALFTILACIMIILQGCAKDMLMEENEEAVQGNSSAYHKTDAKKVKEVMDARRVTTVGVRTQREYRERHISDVVLVPNEATEDRTKNKFPDTDAILIIHCRTGVHSKQVSDKPVQVGYKNVYVFDSINDWSHDTVSE